MPPTPGSPHTAPRALPRGDCRLPGMRILRPALATLPLLAVGCGLFGSPSKAPGLAAVERAPGIPAGGVERTRASVGSTFPCPGRRPRTGAAVRAPAPGVDPHRPAGAASAVGARRPRGGALGTPAHVRRGPHGQERLSGRPGHPVRERARRPAARRDRGGRGPPPGPRRADRAGGRRRQGEGARTAPAAAPRRPRAGGGLAAARQLGAALFTDRTWPPRRPPPSPGRASRTPRGRCSRARGRRWPAGVRPPP